MKFNVVGHSFIGKSTGYYNLKKEALIGGGEVYLFDFAKFLQNEGHEVTIIQARDKNEEFEFEGIKVKGFKPIVRLSGAKGIVERYGFFNMTWKNHLDKDVDRVHLHDFLHAFPRADRTMTGTCHGITWDNPNFVRNTRLGYQMRYYRKVIRPMAKFAVRRLKKVIANDTFLLRFVQSEMPQYRDKIDVILNYVDIDKFNPENKASVKKNYEGRKIILFPRNMGYGRGAINSATAMIEVAKKHPEALLLMTGEGPEKPIVKEIIKKNKLENNVHIIGHQDHFKDMPSLFASADIVIIPSTSTEGTSLSALEAMATGKPVIVSNIGGLPDIVINELNGLLVKPDADSLAEGILRYLDDEGFAKRMATAGQAWVEKRHNYKLWCKKYKESLNI